MRFLFISYSIMLIMLSGCSGLKTAIRDCDSQPILDCEVAFKQFARTLSLQFGIAGLTVLGAEFGAKKQIEVDSITSDLLVHIHQLCTDFNSCMLTHDEYKSEMRFLLHAQLNIRGYDDSAQNPAMNEVLKTMFTELGKKAQVRTIQQLLNILGYEVAIDGTNGRQTQKAILSFARDHESDIQQNIGSGIDQNLFINLYTSVSKMSQKVLSDTKP